MIPSSRTGPPLLMRRVDSIVAEGDESVYRADATAGNQSTTIGAPYRECNSVVRATVWTGTSLGWRLVRMVRPQA